MAIYTRLNKTTRQGNRHGSQPAVCARSLGSDSCLWRCVIVNSDCRRGSYHRPGPGCRRKVRWRSSSPLPWVPSHKAADGHAFRRHLWSALFARRLSQTADMVASGGSDSSAQVLRNSRPEFRPPDASTYGFITETLTTRASGVGAPEIM